MSHKLLTLVIIHKDGKVLLGMKKRGFGMGKWNGFGGKVEQGETIEQAAKRELFEEAGITADSISRLGILEFSWQDKGGDILEVHIFKARDFFGEPVETEEMKPQWFLVKDIPYEKMWADDIHWLPLFLEGKKFKGNFIFSKDNNVLNYTLQ